jgi:hypothetical protein
MDCHHTGDSSPQGIENRGIRYGVSSTRGSSPQVIGRTGSYIGCHESLLRLAEHQEPIGTILKCIQYRKKSNLGGVQYCNVTNIGGTPIEWENVEPDWNAWRVK